MSKEYLKTLQERAQRLLEASSDEEQDINAYTVRGAASRSGPTIDLDDFLINDPDDHDQIYSESPKSPDIALLKRCISLTNENNDLRKVVLKQ